ncbi:MAG: TetR/AcrR family transcriptional regulator [Chloroflexi bacterium]|nr:MAG: TetR/AcrR family transcriptional regulator [Chloroflexota bacterium]TMG26978.1 MAG: TetR/AcrR family transcriptional regulator [Chloroflexota bacterium]
MARRYRLKARAQRQEDNRRRIVEATYQLHMTIGPSRATMSAIARLAGVKRPTVQRHFPDLSTLFMACSLHGMQLDPPPDPAAWQRIADPGRRLLTALCELYPFYRRNRTVWADMPNFFGVPGLEALWAAAGQQRNWQRDVLAAGWEIQDDRRESMLAAIGHAIDFWAWRSLTESQGLDDEKAAILMTEMVGGVAR